MTETKKHEFCSIHGLVMKIMWIMVGVAISYAGTSIGFAIDMRSTVTRLSTVSEQTVSDIKDLKNRQDRIDDKLDRILAAVSPQQKVKK